MSHLVQGTTDVESQASLKFVKLKFSDDVMNDKEAYRSVKN